ncbi:hypothetical protein L209DRAFT_388378 [Thermothelomyces heterothallicus CBS 203.75]
MPVSASAEGNSPPNRWIGNKRTWLDSDLAESDKYTSQIRNGCFKVVAPSLVWRHFYYRRGGSIANSF